MHVVLLTLIAQLWTEQLTHGEIRDRVRAGNSTVLIASGGIEDNGPYTVSGKHNYVLELVLPAIAKQIGGTLIAPIVRFGPGGSIGVEQATFEALLTDLCGGYKMQGFRDIILIGDSGGNQAGMERVAMRLNAKWRASSTRVHYLPEYYNEDRWSYLFLKSKGIVQIDQNPPKGKARDRRDHTRNGIHDDVHYEAQLAALDPELIRASSRARAKQLSLHGVNLAPIEKTAELGRELASYRANITAKAYERSLKRLRP